MTMMRGCTAAADSAAKTDTAVACSPDRNRPRPFALPVSLSAENQ